MVNRIKNYFGNLKLSRKMFWVYIVLFGAFTLISIFSHQITLNIYDDQIYEKSLQELHYFVKAIDDELNEIDKISYNIAMDYEMQRNLSSVIDEEAGSNIAEIRNYLTTRIQNEALSADNIVTITYTNQENLTLPPLGRRYLEIPEDLTAEIIEKAEEARGATINIFPTRDFPYILSGRNIRKHLDYSLDYLGTIILASDFHDIIGNNYGILNNMDSDVSIISDGEVIYGDDITGILQESAMSGERGYRVLNQNKEKYFFCYLKDAGTGWTFINRFPYSSIFYMNTWVRNLMIGIFIVLFVSALFIILKICGIITSPLEQLTESMKLVETGEFQEARDHLAIRNREDEIGILEKNFNIMLEKIIVLIYENYEKQLILKDTQYQMLQSQINPHFLYNTLNSINWMIMAGRDKEASSMIVSLGDLLRSAFNKAPMSSVEEEIEFLNCYIAIQKERYKKRAKFIIKTAGDMERFSIPRMILQPIVENAIYYAVDESLTPCTIEVSIWESDNWLHIHVTDDGPGMEQEYLDKVNRFEMEPRRNGIGLRNIWQRLELIFGEKARFAVESELGVGTRVKITVPETGGEEIVQSRSH